MGLFSKVEDRILDSTLWEEPPEARLVFLGMLFASDLDGNLPIRTESALARRLNLTPEFLEKGLAICMAPDPRSGNPDHEGRRVIRTEDGWLVVSKAKYVAGQTSQQQAWAAKKARWRARQAVKKQPQAHSAASFPHKPSKREQARNAKLENDARVLYAAGEPPEGKP
jgi:hypothetical protein